MNDTQNNGAIENAPRLQQAVKDSYQAKMESKKQFYLELSLKMCPGLSPEASDELRLRELLQKTKRVINMLTCFDRPWEQGMPEVQKACLTFLTIEKISRAERIQCIQKWTQWTDFLLVASRHRGLITNLLQDYYVQLRDLERLVGRAPAPLAVTDPQ